jgi:hypothetical protein
VAAKMIPRVNFRYFEGKDVEPITSRYMNPSTRVVRIMPKKLIVNEYFLDSETTVNAGV